MEQTTVYTAAEQIRGLEREVARLTHDLAAAQRERDEAREEFRAAIVSLGDTQESLSACRALTKKLGPEAREAAYEDAAEVAREHGAVSDAPAAVFETRMCDLIATAILKRAQAVRVGDTT